ncbi:hypothetical protein VTI74DRAFT_1965 [Chaetomium olivicolor]
MASSGHNGPDDNRAECPFTVTIVDPNPKKRRRTGNGAGLSIKQQISPFVPRGEFRSYDTMDLFYQVNPATEWARMARYRKFILNGEEYSHGSFIYVAHESSIKLRKVINDGEPMQCGKRSDLGWVAYILEIRASDIYHVYARVYWMYWPDDLLEGTHDGTMSIQGRQSYHGIDELIASNHMDIINVVSVASKAVVGHWDERNDEEIQCALYWRQAYDIRTRELSTVDVVCSCKTPANPDKTLLRCSARKCMAWMHEQCLIDSALAISYKRLGTEKPHLPLKWAGKGDDAVRLPLGGAQSRAPSSQEPGAPNNQWTVDKAMSCRKTGRPREKAPEENGVDRKPWVGLFEATLNTERTGPPKLEYRDLRQDVVGGQKTWTEPVKCLLCGTTVR